MKNPKLMNVNNLIAFFMLLSTFLVYSQNQQEAIDYFCLDGHGSEFRYVMNDEQTGIVLYSSLPENDFSMSFKIKQIELERSFGSIEYKSFKWLVENRALYYKIDNKDVIELNSFKDLILIKKEKGKCHAFRIINRIFSSI